MYAEVNTGVVKVIVKLNLIIDIKVLF